MWFTYQWEWKNEHGVWTPYSSNIQKELNLLQKKNQEAIVIKATNNQKYLIDIKNESQYNMQYKTKKPIRKILVPQTGKDKIFFYHYTTHKAMIGIIQEHILKASTDGAKGAGVYLTTLQQGTSDEVLAKNNWSHTGAYALQRLDVAFVFEFDRKLLGSKLHNHTEALKRDVWTHDGNIDLKMVPYHVYERRYNGYWTMFKTSHTSKSNIEETGRDSCSFSKSYASPIDNAVSRTVVSPSGTIQGIAKTQQLKVQKVYKDLTKLGLFYAKLGEFFLALFSKELNRLPTVEEAETFTIQFTERILVAYKKIHNREPTIEEAQKSMEHLLQIFMQPSMIEDTQKNPTNTFRKSMQPRTVESYLEKDFRDFVEWLAFGKSLAETILPIFVEKHTRMPTEEELRQEMISFKEAMESCSQDKYGREPTIAEAREVLKTIRQIADELQMVTIQGCSMTEFNGKYVVDYTRNNGWENGKRCFRKKGIFSASNNCTIHYRGDRFKCWALCKNYQWPVYYRNDSVANQPPKGGWVPHQEGSRSTPNKAVKVKTVRTVRVGSKKRVSSKQKNQQIEYEWDVLKLIRILLYTWITWKFLCSWCRSRNRRIQGRDIDFVCGSAFLIWASLESIIQALT